MGTVGGEEGIARKLGKELYVFLCPEDFPYDEESPAESDEKRELQRAYRQQVAEDVTPLRTRGLQEKGVGEALAFLEAKSSQQEELIEAQKKRRDREEKELRKLLQEELLAASLLEKQLRFEEAEDKYRKVVGDAGLWAEPRNALAWFPFKRGIMVEPVEDNVKLKEAAEICRGTLALNQRGESPQDWAGTQNILGAALTELGRRSGAEEGRKLLEEAIAAYRSALEVRTKADLPQDSGATQTNLSIALGRLGHELEGEQRLKRQRESVELLRDVMSYQPDDLTRYWLASTLGRLAFNLVLNSQFAEAQTGAKRLKGWLMRSATGSRKSERDNLIFIRGNLAHALLFQALPAREFLGRVDP